VSKTRISKKQIIIVLACAFLLLVAFILAMIRSGMIRRQESQQMAVRWSKDGDVSQVSCFFSREEGMTKERLLEFEHKLDDVLQQASIVSESENPEARLWASAYSAQTSMLAATDTTSMKVKVMGVGGDFFRFHPQKLRYGNYFYESDLNQDYVVIDEEIAWQLFGGINVPGKVIEVNGKQHVIAGVIKRPQEEMEKQAGLANPILYLSYESYQNLGGTEPINHYEIVMPNPIKNFALDTVKDNIGADENETEIVENTDRFSYVNSLKHFKGFAYRSMNAKAIIYPYWENLARGMEDILAFLTAIVIICIAVPALITAIWLIYRWKHKKWTIKSVWEMLRMEFGKMLDEMKPQKRETRNFGERKARNSVKKEVAPKEPKEKKSRSKKRKAENRTPISITFDDKEEKHE
jgi:hypothetical protein